jgi:L-asparaginase
MTNNLLMLTTGGTIVGQSGIPPDGGHASPAPPKLSAVLEPILRGIREGAWGPNAIGEVHQIDLALVDSSDIVPDHWRQLAELIKRHYDDYAGFIVTHGTNTMGYTCAALSFALPNLGKPVIVTGSQIPYGQPASDALNNLTNAARVAVFPYRGGIRGVVCVFGSHIISGTRAKKNSEFDLDAFQSFSRASIGRIGRTIQVDDKNLDWHHGYLVRGRASPPASADQLEISHQFDSRVLSLTAYPGMSSDLLYAVTAAACSGATPVVRGIVFRAFGAGDVSTELHPCLRELRRLEIPVVVTTQAPNGVSNFRVNAHGQTLARDKLAIPAHDMSIEAMTTKLMWLLGQEKRYDEICALMPADVHGEITVLPERD